MKSVKVNREKLLEKVVQNRTEHRQIFEKAMVGYRKEAIKQLDEMLADAVDGKKIQRFLSLVEPMDQTKEYDRAIAMLEMSVEEEMKITQQQFSELVLDNWAWKGQFTFSTTRYTNL